MEVELESMLLNALHLHNKQGLDKAPKKVQELPTCLLRNKCGALLGQIGFFDQSATCEQNGIVICFSYVLCGENRF